MSNITTTVRAVPAGGSTPTVYIVPALLANTEYSQNLGVNVSQVLIRVRGAAVLKMAFDTGDIASGDYVTIPAGATYSVDGIKYTGSIYFSSSKDAQEVEILTWS